MQLFTALAVSLIAAIAILAGPVRAQEAEVQVSARSTFYRLAIDTTYRGEKLTLDLIVACRVRITNSRLSGESVDANWFPSPLWALRMKDGKAVAVQTPDACSGETSDDGRVPLDFLPLMIVYASADDMTLGIAYLSEDAYENAHAELTLPKATIRRSTEDEWRRWRETAPRNALRPEMRERQVVPGRTTFGGSCAAVRRLRLPSEIQSLVREYWPNDRPHYWLPSQGAIQRLRAAIFSTSVGRGASYEGRPWVAYAIWDRWTTHGLPTRNGSGQVRLRPDRLNGMFPAAIFPMRSDLAVSWIGPHLKTQEAFYWDIDVDREERKGMAYCQSMAIPSTSDFGGPYDAMPAKKQWVCRVDGEIVVGSTECRNVEFLFQRDEFVFSQHSLSLGSSLGADR